MAEQVRLYPIGEQDFPSLRKRGCAYIDKTAYVYRMTHSSSKYMFLSRPRRFGKSLLVSTLQAYFEGRRELFEGLAIEQLEKEWTPYPVIRLDMSLAKHEEPEVLNDYLNYAVEQNEKRLGLQGLDGVSPNLRLAHLIQTASEQSGRQVVVLIDEYDSPLLDVLHEEENLPRLRKVVRNFYSPLKGCAPYLHYVFLTGITKFSQLSIFSELNNIQNISMLPDYAAICGISKEELLTQMSPDIDRLAERMGTTREATMARLVEYYDGYHFTWPSPDIFNPFSLLMAMDNGQVDSYWFGSGTPTYLIEMMRRFGTLPTEIAQESASKFEFDAATETMTDLTPLLYQSGYTTIKAYDPDTETYTLDMPNREIRNGLMLSLLPGYVNQPLGRGRSALTDMYRALLRRDMDGALRVLQAYLRTVPYTDRTRYEGHYQQVLYIIFNLLGLYCDVEVHTAQGRIDLVLRSRTDLYLVELKMGPSADAALRQISLRDYPARFAQCGLPLTRVAIAFDCDTRTLSHWRIEPD